jgi:hypothetical protein
MVDSTVDSIRGLDGAAGLLIAVLLRIRHRELAAGGVGMIPGH